MYIFHSTIIIINSKTLSLTYLRGLEIVELTEEDMPVV